MIYSPNEGPPVPKWLPGWPWRLEKRFFRGESASEGSNQRAGDTSDNGNPMGQGDGKRAGGLLQADSGRGGDSTEKTGGSDVDLNTILTPEQKEWALRYLVNWNDGTKRFYELKEEELKPKFRIKSKKEG